MLHDLFLTAQAWWLENAAGPELLFSFRIFSGVLALMSLGVNLWNAIKPNEVEGTWDSVDARKFRIIAWLKVLGTLFAVCYFLSAAVFEVERTSSPHRLIINNLWAITMLFASFVDAVAWRFHYFRKAELLKVKEVVKQVKA